MRLHLHWSRWEMQRVSAPLGQVRRTERANARTPQRENMQQQALGGGGPGERKECSRGFSSALRCGMVTERRSKLRRGGVQVWTCHP